MEDMRIEGTIRHERLLPCTERNYPNKSSLREHLTWPQEQSSTTLARSHTQYKARPTDKLEVQPLTYPTRVYIVINWGIHSID